jgi:hypothetical protein
MYQQFERECDRYQKELDGAKLAEQARVLHNSINDRLEVAEAALDGVRPSEPQDSVIRQYWRGRVVRLKLLRQHASKRYWRRAWLDSADIRHGVQDHGGAWG